MAKMVFNYYLLKRGINRLCILKQSNDGTDSIGVNAKDHIMLNSVAITQITEDELVQYRLTPLILAKNLEKFLLQDGGVPY
jgi:hypothetical protein